MTCTLGSIPPLTAATVTITAVVARTNNAPSPAVLNTAATTSTSGDPNPTDDVAVTYTCVNVGDGCLPVDPS